MEKSVSVVLDIHHSKVCFKGTPRFQKLLGGEGGTVTRGVRFVLNEVEVTTHKGGNRSVKSKKGLNDFGVLRKLVTSRKEVKVEELEGRACGSVCARCVTTELNVAPSEVGKFDRLTLKKTEDPRAIDNESAGGRTGKVIITDLTIS